MSTVRIHTAYLRRTKTDGRAIIEAHKAVKSHIKDALVILSDDDPSNDAEGYVSLADAFIAVNDDVNAIAVCQALRAMKKGVAVLASDPAKSNADGRVDLEKTEGGEEESGITDAEPEADKDEDHGKTEEADDDDDEGFPFWSCDGVCVRAFYNYDNAIRCRMGCAYFCQSCYTLLLEDKIPFRVCSRAHEHLKIPVLETRFKEGELVVEGKVVALDEWKKSIRKSWGL